VQKKAKEKEKVEIPQPASTACVSSLTVDMMKNKIMKRIPPMIIVFFGIVI
jgi:hypothetical protein